ncbi:TPA: hypothetical protein DCG61_01305 [Patescibacteria group bacterium]|jgi:hypothetical protein|nr:hypothetical protein [Patescibacteria group bacterium]
MSKSQLNNLSKRQILESLMYEQNQSNATLSRLITAVARTAGIDPDKLAENFIDDKANQEYVAKFNAGVKAKHAGNHAAAPVEPDQPTTEEANTDDAS